MYAVAKEVDRSGLSICCLQEVRYRNSGKRRIGVDSGAEYDFIWSGPKRRRDAGVGFLVKVDKHIAASEPDTQDPRIISMNINVHGFKIRLVNVYSPTNTDGTPAQKDEFYRKIRKACISTEKNRKVIVAGDFNAITSVVLRNSLYNGTSIIEDTTCNDNGSRLKQFCRSNKLCMIQSYFDVPLSERFTWFSNDGKTKRVLDYILAERFVQQYVTRCSVASDYKFESDHRLIVTELSTPSTKRARWRTRKKIEKPRNLKALEIQETRKDYASEVINQIPITDENESIDLKSQKIVDALKHAAQNSIPNKATKTTREIWKCDEELNCALQERSQLERNSIAYKELCKKIKKRVQFLRNQKLQIEADELNQFANKRQIENLFQAFKDDSHTFKTCPSNEKCDPTKLKEYFCDHFKNSIHLQDPKELDDIPGFVDHLKKNTSRGMNTSPPESDEIKSALAKLKNGKAANDIPAELLKHAVENEEFLKELTRLYFDVWTQNKVPEHWGHSRLVALWKGPSKGKADDPTTYRGLQIGSTLCKLMVVIIINRIKEWYEEQLSDQQQGFRTGRGTTDGIFLAKALQQIAKKTGNEMNVLFVDLTAAFDHIDRRWLFKTIKQRLQNNMNCKLFDLLETLYASTTTALAGHELDMFIIELGVRQGGSESPLLFNLYIDYVLRVFLVECTRQNIEFVKLKYSIPKSVFVSNSPFGEYGENMFNWIGYADDLVLAFADRENLKKGLRVLDEVFKRFRLAMNVGKTKTMIYNYQGPVEDYPASIATVREEKVENVKKFKYLGSQIHYKQATTGEAEITSRIDMAESKFYEHGKKFMNYRIKLSVRISILNSIVRSRLTYGCQTWILTTAQKDRLNAAYTSMIRKMVRGGYKRKQDEWGYKLTNQNLLDIGKTEAISAFIERQKKRYLAHLIRLPNTSVIKRILFNSDTTTVPGRQTTFLQSVLDVQNMNLQQFGRLALAKKI